MSQGIRYLLNALARRILPLAGLWLLAACQPEPATGPIRLAGAALGTGYAITLVRPPAALEAKRLEAEIRRLLDDLEAKLSNRRQDSELSEFNRNSETDWIPASRELVAVVDEGQRTARLSDGAFDLTIAPLRALWGFGAGAGAQETPEPSAIQTALKKVGYADLQVRHYPPALRKARGNLSLDLSALAQGYAVDRMAELLDQHGVKDYLVDLGGDLRVQGHGLAGRPWRVAVQTPAEGGARRVLRLLSLSNTALASSGGYRNFSDKQGRGYAYIIDPRTGRGARHKLASVTVISNSAIRADALATALLVLGPDRGLALAQSQDIPALFVIRANGGFEQRTSAGFLNYLGD